MNILILDEKQFLKNNIYFYSTYSFLKPIKNKIK